MAALPFPDRDCGSGIRQPPHNSKGLSETRSRILLSMAMNRTQVAGSEERSGSAFEYAVAISLQKHTPATLLLDNAALRSKEKYLQLTTERQKRLSACAEKSALYLATVDERLVKTKGLQIRFNSSHNAKAHHDVRDLLVASGNVVIGISCKVNNEDLRHSRLSGTSDFVQEWGLSDSGASTAYWRGVKPVFSHLKELKSNGLKWDQVYPGDSSQRNERKLAEIVAPVLDEWEKEMSTLISMEKNLATNLCRYLLGSKSYWKVIAKTPITPSQASRDTITIQRFDLEGDMPGAKLVMPKKILGIHVQPRSRARERIVTCDQSYSFGFRLHTAESQVVSSLKFAVKGRGLPAAIDQASFRI